MRGTWKLKLRMILTSVIMFTIVYFLIFLVGRYLGISSWRIYAVVSLVIVFLQYWFGPSIVKRSMNVRPLSEAEAPLNWEYHLSMFQMHLLMEEQVGVDILL